MSISPGTYEVPLELEHGVGDLSNVVVRAGGDEGVDGVGDARLQLVPRVGGDECLVRTVDEIEVQDVEV